MSYLNDIFIHLGWTTSEVPPRLRRMGLECVREWFIQSGPDKTRTLGVSGPIPEGQVAYVRCNQGVKGIIER